jgi:hypothetical protein
LKKSKYCVKYLNEPECYHNLLNIGCGTTSQIKKFINPACSGKSKKKFSSYLILSYLISNYLKIVFEEKISKKNNFSYVREIKGFVNLNDLRT